MSSNTYKIFLGSYVALILGISSVPMESLPDLKFNHADKIFHFTEFFILGFLALKSFSIDNNYKLAVVLASCAIFGAFDEWWQSFVSNRFTSFGDFIADGLGVLLSGFFFNPKEIK